jgi:hypothetical protein
METLCVSYDELKSSQGYVTADKLMEIVDLMCSEIPTELSNNVKEVLMHARRCVAHSVATYTFSLSSDSLVHLNDFFSILHLPLTDYMQVLASTVGKGEHVHFPLFVAVLKTCVLYHDYLSSAQLLFESGGLDDGCDIDYMIHALHSLHLEMETKQRELQQTSHYISMQLLSEMEPMQTKKEHVHLMKPLFPSVDEMETSLRRASVNGNVTYPSFLQQLFRLVQL